MHTGQRFDRQQLSGFAKGTGAEPYAAVLFQAFVGTCLGVLRIGLSNQRSDHRKALTTYPVAEETVVADACEASGQGVQEEPSEELRSGEFHLLFLRGVFTVRIDEADGAVIDLQAPRVGDRHRVGVAAQISQSKVQC